MVVVWWRESTRTVVVKSEREARQHISEQLTSHSGEHDRDRVVVVAAGAGGGAH